jgi:hypothetical protein
LLICPTSIKGKLVTAITKGRETGMINIMTIANNSAIKWGHGISCATVMENVDQYDCCPYLHRCKSSVINIIRDKTMNTISIKRLMTTFLAALFLSVSATACIHLPHPPHPRIPHHDHGHDHKHNNGHGHDHHSAAESVASGVIVGAIIGSEFGHEPHGALVGALAGATIGLLYNEAEREVEAAERHYDRYYVPAPTPRVEPDPEVCGGEWHWDDPSGQWLCYSN